MRFSSTTAVSLSRRGPREGYKFSQACAPVGPTFGDDSHPIISWRRKVLTQDFGPPLRTFYRVSRSEISQTMLANRTSCSTLTLTRSVTLIIGLLQARRTPSAGTSALTDSLYRFRNLGATFLEYGLAGQRANGLAATERPNTTPAFTGGGRTTSGMQ
jgi:hypothetical protein